MTIELEGVADKWCVLTTAAPRTLLLADELTKGGVAAWTPRETLRKAGRGKARHEFKERESPITPTFVFVPADRAFEMALTARSPISPFPPFAMLRNRDRGIALIRDIGLAPLRAEEERLRLRHRKTRRRVIAAGTVVRLSEGAFAGMTGIVESGSGKVARINFGSGFSVSIATYLLGPEVLYN